MWIISTNQYWRLYNYSDTPKWDHTNHNTPYTLQERSTTYIFEEIQKIT